MNPRFKVTGCPKSEIAGMIEWLKTQPEYKEILFQVTEKGIQISGALPVVHTFESTNLIVEAWAFSGDIRIKIKTGYYGMFA